jgi:hypothetical protein
MNKDLAPFAKALVHFLTTSKTADALYPGRP